MNEVEIRAYFGTRYAVRGLTKQNSQAVMNTLKGSFSKELSSLVFLMSNMIESF
jgi:hypothetical protein